MHCSLVTVDMYCTTELGHSIAIAKTRLFFYLVRTLLSGIKNTQTDTGRGGGSPNVLTFSQILKAVVQAK